MKKTKRTKKSPSRKEILTEILDCFQGMFQWLTTLPEHYTKYANQAEVLIELLEVVDCGSVGGFDRNNPSVVRPADGSYLGSAGSCRPKVDETGFALFDRFLMVLRKYDTKLSPICGHDVYFFVEFFTMLEGYKYR